MSQTTLVASTGRETGSPASRRLRATDQIPGVLYGQGMTPVSVAVARRDLRVALSGPAGFNTVLQLQVDGKVYPAVIKDVQRHPVKRNVSHIDFLQVNMSEKITVSVPLHITGEAKAVLAEGGLVDPSVDNIEVECTPGNMPNEFSVDISAMVPGDVIRLSSLVMPAGVVALGDPDMAIVSAIHGSQGADSAPAAPAAE
ncbi:MAG: 50S ribosomal protein L25 [Actinomycetota bacterium]|jgi:large subunit ribosomal protein L25